MVSSPRTVVIVGVQGSGKSTVGAALAARLERAAFIEGDLLWQMVVAGRVDMSPQPTGEALQQLELRYRHGALLAESFVAHGFTAIHVDNIYGHGVVEHLASLRCARSLVVLRPRPDEVVRRELERGTNAYAGWVDAECSLLEAVEQFDQWLAETPRIGLWVDSTNQTVDETVTEIITRWDEAVVDRSD